MHLFLSYAHVDEVVVGELARSFAPPDSTRGGTTVWSLAMIGNASSRLESPLAMRFCLCFRRTQWNRNGAPGSFRRRLGFRNPSCPFFFGLELHYRNPSRICSIWT